MALSTLEAVKALHSLSVEKTRNLVFHLGVPPNVLDDIEEQYNGDTRKQKFIEKWLDNDTNASWGAIVFELKQIDMNVLAANIQSMYLSTKPIPKKRTKLPVSTTSAAVMQPELVTPVQPDHSTTSILKSDPLLLPVNEERVEDVKASIEYFENEFSEIMSDTRSSLSERESQDRKFLDKFRDHLLLFPVTKKATHVMFFLECEDEILEAKNIRKLFAILSRYCNYSNYEIIFIIIKKFGKDTLKKRMIQYQASFERFEVETTIDIYLSAISAHPEGQICRGFNRMAMTINKPTRVCTLHEIRQLKESIAENASVQSYGVYIAKIDFGSIKVVLFIHAYVASLMKAVMTTEFLHRNFLKEVVLELQSDDDISLSQPSHGAVFPNHSLGDIPRSKSESLWIDTTSDDHTEDNAHVQSAPPLPPKPMDQWPYTEDFNDDQTGDSGLGTGSGAVQYGEREKWKRAIMLPPPMKVESKLCSPYTSLNASTLMPEHRYNGLDLSSVLNSKTSDLSSSPQTTSLSVSEIPFNLKKFQEQIGSQIPNKWREFGLALDIPSFELDAYSVYRNVNHFACVFKSWEKKGTPELSWRTVIQILESSQVDEIIVAQNLKLILPDYLW